MWKIHGPVQMDAVYDGKVRWKTDEYTTAFLRSDWLHFLWQYQSQTRFRYGTYRIRQYLKVVKCIDSDARGFFPVK